jgi:hypothetical protein
MARAWVSSPRYFGRSEGWMFSIRPCHGPRTPRVRTRMNPARHRISGPYGARPRSAPPRSPRGPCRRGDDPPPPPAGPTPARAPAPRHRAGSPPRRRPRRVRPRHGPHQRHHVGPAARDQDADLEGSRKRAGIGDALPRRDPAEAVDRLARLAQTRRHASAAPASTTRTIPIPALKVLSISASAPARLPRPASGTPAAGGQATGRSPPPALRATRAAGSRSARRR